MTFFCEKSLLCRYSALSLHSKTDERRLLLGSLCLRSGFALPSLCLRSGSTPKSGDKTRAKRDETDFAITIYRIENWLARRVAKGEFVVQCDDNECD